MLSARQARIGDVDPCRNIFSAGPSSWCGECNDAHASGVQGRCKYVHENACKKTQAGSHRAGVLPRTPGPGSSAGIGASCALSTTVLRVSTLQPKLPVVGRPAGTTLPPLM